MRVDEPKSLLDLAMGRDYECFHRDGHMLVRTPSIDSANWPSHLVWPRLASHPARDAATDHRSL